jgi:hypothetical protein
MLAHLADQFANGTVRIVCAAAPEEERGILFPECVEATVGADGLTRSLSRRPLAMDGG